MAARSGVYREHRAQAQAPVSSVSGVVASIASVDAVEDAHHAEDAEVVAPPPLHRAGAEGKPDTQAVPAARCAMEHGDFWYELAQKLLQDPAVTAMVRELVLRSQLRDRGEDAWTLLVDNASLVRDAYRDRLSAALDRAGWKVRLVLEVGTVTDTPALRRAVEQDRLQEQAAQIVAADPFVQTLVRDFGARIVTESIRMA